MSGLNLAKNVGLELRECKTFSERLECSAAELEKILREKISDGIFVAWQIQCIVWGKIGGENFLPNVEDLLEIRLFNRREEIHFKRADDKFVGRYVRDDDGTGTFYADSFARLWGEKISSTNGFIKLADAPRKISMEIPCDDGDKKFYGLTTRNYIDSDAATGLSGYVDYRFVAIESAWDGD
ncbi:MAG: hypothetical protein IKP64_07770 [Selenomonadaceae bacterium]|nr:hypothetical protein [Selenomonadaceae bacterium]MBR4383440.1 hypothetical protein [Selenomonadaceae bacterium]